MRWATRKSTLVIVGLPNDLHKEAVLAAAAAGKAVLCTKPLGRNAAEAMEMLEAVEQAGVFHGYLEDLVYTPKTLKALESVRQRSGRPRAVDPLARNPPRPAQRLVLGQRTSGGGAIMDMGCHCIEIGRNFIGKDVRPVEVMCWADTQVHPIEAEDHAIGLVRYENGAVGQFEVSWSFRGGMDLRDEVAGTEGTSGSTTGCAPASRCSPPPAQGGYVAEKAEAETGWLFPVGDEVRRAGLRRHVHRHAGRPRRRSAPRGRPSTTATWSTRSWTPATARCAPSAGSRSSRRSGAPRPRAGPLNQASPDPPAPTTMRSTCFSSGK